MDATVTIERRLRPERIAVVVDPRSIEQVQRAVAFHSGVWGGACSPIVPALRRRPRWWTDFPLRELNGPAITAGYLDAWSPDALVVMDDAYVPSARLDLRASLPEEVEGGPQGTRLGMSIDRVLEYLYREERRFVQADPQDIWLMETPDDALRPFVEAVFGQVTPERRSFFVESLSADAVEATPETYWQATVRDSRSILSPLRLGRAGLRRDSRRILGPTAFVLDAASPPDLIDFWNLRAAGHDVIALPVQWWDPLLPMLGRDLASRPLEVMFARSLPEDGVDDCDAQLRALQLDATWAAYPTLWRNARSFRRDTTHWWATRDSIDVPVRREYVEIAPLVPSFVDDRDVFDDRWVTLLTVRPSLVHDEIATLFPPEIDVDALRRLLNVVSATDVRATEKGIAFTRAFPRDAVVCRLPRAEMTICALLAGRGHTAEVSKEGHLTLGMIRRLGGINGVNLIAGDGMIRMLEKMARSEAAAIRPNGLRDAIKSIPGMTPRRVDDYRRRLIERKVFESAAPIECPHCHHRGLFGPDEIGERLRCEECLREFPFPHEAPPGDWQYRTLGGFRTRRGSAVGRYPVMLALRFLSRLRGSDHDLNWSTSLHVGNIGEVDFLALCTRGMRGFGSDVDLLLGEAKLHKPLDDHDFQRARRLRRHLPDAVLVFATLNENGFTGPERDELLQLARPTVTSTRQLPPRANLMLLTPRELYAQNGPGQPWNEGKPGRPDRVRYMSDPTAFACDRTQALHLGVEPFDEWCAAETSRLRARVARRRT